MVPCLYFVFYVSTEGWVVVSDGAGGNVLLARPGDYFVEVFYREPYVVVICYVVVLQLFLYCGRESGQFVFFL